MAVIDVEVIALRATKRYGLKFVPSKEDIDGETLSLVRPKELENGNGFSITISSTSRVIEVGFRADNFAGSLLRRMGDASDDKIESFIGAIQHLDENYDLEFYLNGNEIQDAKECFSDEKWQKLELSCDNRYSKEQLKNPETLNNLSTKITLDLLDAVVSILPIKQEIPDLFEIGLPEGAKAVVQVNKYERSPVNRAKCIDQYGYKCDACDFDFEKVYGEVGRDYIEVHHTTPVSEMGEGYSINPIIDLVPLCSNCHSIAHKRNPPYTVKEIQSFLMRPNCETIRDESGNINEHFEIDLGEEEFE